MTPARAPAARNASRADAVLRFYQRWISPPLHGVSNALGIVPAGCRYQPTCSEYAREAIARHGLGRGSRLAAARLLRCHPFARSARGSSYDPVP
jgi:putative membrane protein insertion efficiency factor